MANRLTNMTLDSSRSSRKLRLYNTLSWFMHSSLSQSFRNKQCKAEPWELCSCIRGDQSEIALQNCNPKPLDSLMMKDEWSPFVRYQKVIFDFKIILTLTIQQGDVENVGRAKVNRKQSGRKYKHVRAESPIKIHPIQSNYHSGLGNHNWCHI